MAYQAQITEIHTLRTIALRSCSGQSLTETRRQRKKLTNMCSGAEILEIHINKFGDFKSTTFNVHTDAMDEEDNVLV